MTDRKVTRDDLSAAADKFKNWGKWGDDDEIGALNYTSAEDIIAAAQLVKKGKVISMALNFDNAGPQWAVSTHYTLCYAQAQTRIRACSITVGSAPLTTWW